MKILFINGTKNIGGGELSLLSIAKFYREKCSVVSFNRGDYTELLEENNIDSLILSNAKKLLDIKRENGLWGVLRSVKFLLKTILELRLIIRNYDVIYANSQKGILLSLLAGLGISKCFIIHVRDMMDNPNISDFQRFIFRFLIYLKSPLIIANSDATKKSLNKIGITKNIKVVYNGITLSEINNIKNMNKDKFIVAMFSRISHWKGQEYFIEAVYKLKREYRNFANMEFWIVGDAVMGSEEEKYKNKILNLIKKYNLEKNIKLFGFVKNPIKYMKNINVLVLPSIYPEPFGRVVVEAMLLKKVVIATNHGGVTEIINHLKDGILIDINNLSDNLFKFIINLFENKELYNQLSEKAYLKASKSFTEEKMIKSIDKLIKECYENSNSSRLV